MFQNLSEKLGEWFDVKLRLSQREHLPLFKEREIWWCSIGLNVGYEVFGKQEDFIRPVLIVRKYNKYTFLGLPLTSKRKDIPAHYHFDFNGRNGSVLLDQSKTLDSRRLSDKIGRINESDFRKIKEGFARFNLRIPLSSEEER